MRLAPLLALPPIALGIAAAVWMIAQAPGPAQIDREGRPPCPSPGHDSRGGRISARPPRPGATCGLPTPGSPWPRWQGGVIWRHPDLEAGRLISPGGNRGAADRPGDYELALAQSRARPRRPGSRTRASLRPEADNTRRILALERGRLALAETDLERTRTLVAQGTMPQSRADEAERATLLARRTVAELENTLALIPSREARIAAQVARSEAAIDRARRSLDRTTLTTPFAASRHRGGRRTLPDSRPRSGGNPCRRAFAAAEVVAHLPIDSFRRLVGDAVETMTLADMMRDGSTRTDRCDAQPSVGSGASLARAHRPGRGRA